MTNRTEVTDETTFQIGDLVKVTSLEDTWSHYTPYLKKFLGVESTITHILHFGSMGIAVELEHSEDFILSVKSLTKVKSSERRTLEQVMLEVSDRESKLYSRIFELQEEVADLLRFKLSVLTGSK